MSKNNVWTMRDGIQIKVKDKEKVMKQIFEEMNKIGWNEDYATQEMLDYDYSNLDKFYCKYVDKTKEELKEDGSITDYIVDSDVIASIGYILDFVIAVKNANKEENK